LTYAVFKSVTTGLLTGDNVLPKDDEVLNGLVQYALITVATQADSLHLLTLDTNANILRLANSDYLIRMPVAPVASTDLLDIDEELTFAVARYVASYLSKAKGGIHVNAASRIIKDYNAKTWETIEQMALVAAEAAVPDTLTTLWTA